MEISGRWSGRFYQLTPQNHRNSASKQATFPICDYNLDAIYIASPIVMYPRVGHYALVKQNFHF